MEIRIYYVYKHLTADTGELFYIGKGKYKRAYDTSCGRNRKWKNIVNKHGFVVEFIKENLTEEEALNLEKEEIATHHPRANLSTGGRGGATGYKHTEESLKRRSATQSRLKSTPEARLKNSIRQKEVQNRPEVKEAARLGKALFWEKLAKGEIPNPWIGRIITQETRKKLSERFKGEKAYYYRKITPIAKSVTNLNTGETFPSITAAAKSLGGKNHRSLSRCIRTNIPYKKNRFVINKK
jgi:hypothetical protein